MNLSEINFIKLLKSFSNTEIKEFKKFVSSPFFNSQIAHINLYKELIKYYPEFNSINLTKEKIFKAVFPDKIYNDTLLRKYISNLMKMAEDYLIYKDISGNKERRMTFLLDQYDKKHLTLIFERQLIKTENELSLNGKINVETFYYKHFREELKASNFTRIGKLHLIKNCIVKSHTYVLLHILLTNTVYTNMMLIIQKSFRDSEDDHDFFEKFNSVFDVIGYLEKIEDLSDFEKLFIALCKIDVLIFKDPYKIDNLKIMKMIIFKMTDILSDNLLYIFFSHLNIYYLLNISKDIEELNRDLFENYKFMIERGLYISEDKEFINFSEYRTILLYSLRLKEFDWTEKFIDQYKDYHDPELAMNIYNYSKALMSFEKNDFERSLKIISLLKIKDMIMKMDLDILLLLIYYELNYIDTAISLIDSFRHYMLKNKIFSKEVVQNQLDFLKYYRTILMEKNNITYSADLSKLKSEIQNNKNLRRKNWLIEKINIRIEKSGSS